MIHLRVLEAQLAVFDFAERLITEEAAEDILKDGPHLLRGNLGEHRIIVKILTPAMLNALRLVQPSFRVKRQ